MAMEFDDTRSPGWCTERGFALPVALMVLLLLSVLAAGSLFVANQEVFATSNYRVLSQSSYIAEAGLQRGIEWLINTYPTLPGTTNAANFNGACYPSVPAGDACGSAPVLLAGITPADANYPLADVQDAFVEDLSDQPLVGGTLQGTYSVDAQLLNISQVSTGMFPPFQVDTKEKWLLTARGQIAGGTQQGTVTASAVLEKLFRTFFSDALYGICSVSRVAGNTATDSYNSDQGPYGVGNQSNTQAGVGSNGRVTTQGNTTAIGGDVTFGPGNPAAGCPAGTTAAVNSAVVNGTIQSGAPRTFPALPAFPSPGGPDITLTGNDIDNRAPGNYGEVRVSANASLVLNGSGDVNNPNIYNFDSISLTGGNSVILINPPGSNVHINIRGTTITPPPSGDCAGSGAHFAGQGIFSGNPPPPPRTVSINYYGTNCLVMTGGSTFSGLIYAPNGTVMLGGNGNLYGAVVANNTELFGNRSVHYDRSLQDERGAMMPLQVVAFSRPRF